MEGGKKEERGRDVTSLDVNAHRGETIMSRRNYMLSKPLSPCYRANRHCVKFDARKNWRVGCVYIRTRDVSFERDTLYVCMIFFFFFF